MKKAIFSASLGLISLAAWSFSCGPSKSETLYLSCNLTAGNYRYVATCKKFASFQEAKNFCENEWYAIIGAPILTHVSSLYTSDSNLSMAGCQRQYEMFLNMHKPYSNAKILLSNKAGVESYKMGRDVEAEDTMPSDL